MNEDKAKKNIEEWFVSIGMIIIYSFPITYFWNDIIVEMTHYQVGSLDTWEMIILLAMIKFVKEL